MKLKLAVFALSVMCLCSCSKSDGQKRYLIGFANATWGDPWRVSLNNDMKEAVAEFNKKQMERMAAEKNEGEKKKYFLLDLDIADGQDKNDTQIGQVKNFIQRKVDVLIVSPNEAGALTSVVEEAYKAGIPTIVIDRNITKEAYTTFIGASNEEIGKAAGKYLVGKIGGKIGGKDKIVEIRGTDGATATIDRNKGFMDVIRAYPEIRVLDSQPADYKRSIAQDKMTTMLQAHPDINAVYAHNDEMAIGAYNAAKAVGREKSMIFIGIDGQESCIQMIREGKIHATFDYPRPSKKAIEAAIRILKGENGIDKKIPLDTCEITTENAAKIKGF